MAETLRGYAGQQLRVQLDRQQAHSEPISSDATRRFVGGVGYGAQLLLDELEPGIDPLGPHNKLVIATGPLSLNTVPGGGTLLLCFKSPLTGGWGESRCGGDFGPDLRRAGFDHVIIEGKAPRPVYLVIDDRRAEFRPAAHLQGKSVSEKREIIYSELSESGCSVLCIGPGGENLVRFANVMLEDRAAGRCGAGAVLGSKNLLGVAVRGRGRGVDPADPDRLRQALREAFRVLREHPTSTGFRDYGTIGDIPSNDERGDWPTKNWQSNSWGRGPDLFDHFQDRNFVRGYGCYRGCPIACGRKARVGTGPYQTPEHGGAEYESISCFTAYVLNEDMDAAVHCTYLCNEYGVDTISTGSVIAFAMECYERNLLSGDEIGDLDLRWGNAEVLPRLVQMIATRQGIGDVLADGVRAAARQIGHGAADFAVHVKGLEGPAHDPRSGKALALAYGTASRGMCHIHPVEAMAWDSGKLDWGLQAYDLRDPESVERWEESGKGAQVKLLQDALILPDVLGTCKFFMYAGITIDHWAEMLSALIGWEVDGKALLRVGERTINLQRLFNRREGFSPADDAIPARVRSLPAFGNYSQERACAVGDYEGMLQDYYAARGWHPETGVPTPAKLRELGLL